MLTHKIESNQTRLIEQSQDQRYEQLNSTSQGRSVRNRSTDDHASEPFKESADYSHRVLQRRSKEIRIDG